MEFEAALEFEVSWKFLTPFIADKGRVTRAASYAATARFESWVRNHFRIMPNPGNAESG